MERGVLGMFFGSVICEILGWMLLIMFGTNFAAKGAAVAFGWFGALLIVAGIVMLIVALLAGIAHGKAEASGPERTLQGARVLTRYGIAPGGTEYLMDWQYTDDTNYYVKLQHPQVGTMEYRCAAPVFANCPDGVVGEATVQGKWLSRFMMYSGVGVADPNDKRYGNSSAEGGGWKPNQ